MTIDRSDERNSLTFMYNLQTPSESVESAELTDSIPGRIYNHTPVGFALVDQDQTFLYNKPGIDPVNRILPS
jgi:hypothetical protein